MRPLTTTILDVVGLACAVVGGFLVATFVGWFVLAASILFVSWRSA